MVLVQHPRLFIAWHWPRCGLVFRRPASHMTVCWVGPFEITFPDLGYVMPYTEL